MRTLLFAAATLVLAFSDSARAELKFDQLRKEVTAEPKAWGVRTTFNYTNTGKQKVRISEIKGGCSCCTKAKASLKDVPPGASGTIQVRVSLHKKTLPFLRPITVTTSDGKVVVLLVNIVAAKP